MSNAVDKAASTEVEPLSPEEAALVEANQSEANASDYIVPILKLAQPLTEEVTGGDARPGQFVLTLTGQVFDAPIEFVVAGKSRGRFKGGRRGERTLVAHDTEIVPWQDDPFYGRPFSEHPDAEETYSARANAKEIPWGQGPPIQTTANYTGFIVGTDIPVRFSIRMSNKHSRSTARKWNTLLDAVLRGRYWDQVFELGVAQETNADGDRFYVPTVRQLRKTSAEERQHAIELATVLRSQTVKTVGDEGTTPAKAPASSNDDVEY